MSHSYPTKTNNYTKKYLKEKRLILIIIANSNERKAADASPLIHEHFFHIDQT